MFKLERNKAGGIWKMYHYSCHWRTYFLGIPFFTGLTSITYFTRTMAFTTWGPWDELWKGIPYATMWVLLLAELDIWFHKKMKYHLVCSKVIIRLWHQRTLRCYFYLYLLQTSRIWYVRATNSDNLENCTVGLTRAYTDSSTKHHTYIYIYIYMCVCVWEFIMFFHGYITALW